MNNFRLHLSLIAITILLPVFSNAQQSVGIGTNSPNPRAVLQLVSPGQNQGFLLPKLTTTEINTMPVIASDRGLMVYDSLTNEIKYWSGTLWISMGSGGATSLNSLSDVTLTAPAIGSYLRYNGVDWVNSSTIFPINETVAAAGTQFQLNQTGPGTTFRLTNSSPLSTDFVMSVEAFGDAIAGYFVKNNPASTNQAIYSHTLGTGPALVSFGLGNNSTAARFANTSISSNQPSVIIENAGTGLGLNVASGGVRVNRFGGGGNKMIVTNNTGVLDTAALPTSQWITNGSNIFYNSGNVGIGTITPTERLHVVGNSRVTGISYSRSVEVFDTLNQASFFRTNSTVQAQNYIEFSTGRYNGNNNRTDSRWQLGLSQLATPSDNDFFGIGRNNIGYDFVVNRAGFVGIGAETPTERLDVVGNLKFSGAIMPNNQPGSSGQVLTSSGPGLPPTWTSAGGSGTVTSVGLTLSGIFSVSGSPVIGSGTLTGSLINQAQNTVFAGPTSGSNTPSFRALVAGDIPSLPATIITSGTIPIVRGGTNGTAAPTAGAVAYGTGTAYAFTAAGSSGQVLQSNGAGAPTWVNPPASSGWLLSGNTGTTPATQFIGTTDLQDLRFRTDNAERMAITSIGNVGIGVVNPTSRLQVLASGGLNPDANGLYVNNPINSPGEDAILTTRVAGSSAGNPFVSFDIAGEAGYSLGIDNADTNKFKLSATWNSLAASPLITVQQNGFTGFGTSNPIDRLHVAGRVRIVQGQYGLIHTDGITEMGTFVDASAGWFGTNTNHPLWFYTNNQPFPGLMVSVSNNVGIGTVNPTERLEVLGNIRFTGALMPNGLAGNTGEVLTSAGPGLPPTWTAVGGSGTVTSIGTGTGLTGGPITTTGTISLANSGVTIGTYGTASAVGTFTVDATGRLTSASSTPIAISAGQITSGTLPINRGGTNSTVAPVDGGLAYGIGGAYAFNAAGTPGQVLQSNGTGAPTWVTLPSFLTTSLNNGSVLVGNASNVATQVPTGNLTTTTSGLSVTGGAGAVIGTGATINIQNANGTQPGLLTAADWTTFNNKQNAFTPANLLIRGNSGGTALVSSQVFDDGVNVGVGTTSPAYKMQVSGSLAAVGSAPAPIVNDAGTGTTNVCNPQTAGQGFTATQSRNITSIEIDLFGGFSVGNVTLEIYNGLTNTGVPAYSQVFNIAAVPAQGFFAFPLSTPFPVTNGSTYAFKIIPSGCFSFYNSTSNPYTGGDRFFNSVVSTGWDLDFRINYQASGVIANSTGNGELSFSGALISNGNSGISGQVLTSQGSGSAPIWTAVGGLGTVTSIGTGTGLTGGPITTTGTISLANSGVTAGSYGTASAVGTFIVDATGRLTSVANQAIAINASQVTTGTFGITQGGTNSTATPIAGAIAYGTGTAYSFTTAGTMGQLLQSNGAGVPTWVNPPTFAGWGLTGNTGTVAGTNFIGTTDAQDLRIRTNNIERLAITSAGNVGIGITNPSARLQVLASGGTNPDANGILVANTNNSVGQDAIITARVAGTNAGDPYISFDIAGEAGYSLGIDNSDNNSFKLGGFWNGVDGNTLLTIQSGGNMGIGTTTPSQRLDVAGNIRFSGALMPNNIAGTAGQVLSSNGAGVAPTWASPNSFGWGLTGNAGINPAINYLGTSDGQPLVMRTSGTERMRILSGGNVGIGTATPASTFSVVGRGQFGDNSLTIPDANDDLYLEKNSFYTQIHLTNTDLANPDISGFISQNRTGAANGMGNTTPGFNIWTSSNHPIQFGTNSLNRMTISSAGNIGIGNVAPTERLDVTGNVRFSGALMPNNIAGTAGQVLSSNGAGLTPTWTNPSSFGWSLLGNGGTVDGTNYIGTSDNVPFTIRTNNIRSARLEPSLNGNSFFGFEAGLNVPNTSTSTAMGYQALRAATVGSQNTAIGYRAMNVTNNAIQNVAVGMNALLVNTTGSQNTAVGYGVMSANTDGLRNVAMGMSALNANTSGDDNVAIGYQSLLSNSLGNFNVGIGSQALQNTTASNNVAIGVGAGAFNTSGSDNTFLGNGANATVNNLTNATAIGTNASVSQSNTLVLGNNASVGIGTSTPVSRLMVEGTTNRIQALVSNSTIGAWNEISNTSTGGQVFSMISTGSANSEGVGKLIFTRNTSLGLTAGTIMSLVHATSHVGIGSTTPARRLHVVDPSTFGMAIEGTNTTGTILDLLTLGNGATGVNNTATRGWQYLAYGNAFGTASLQNDLTLRSYNGTAATDVMHFDALGNVGLGTTSPTERLEVNGRIQLPNQAITLAGNKLYANGGNLFWGTTQLNTGGSQWITNGANIHYSLGNVGIGVATPAERLDVNGNIVLREGNRTFSVAQPPTNATGGSLQLKAGNAGAGGFAMDGGSVIIEAGHKFDQSFGTSPGSIVMRSGGNIDPSNFAANPSGNFVWESGGASQAFTERMRMLGSNGFLGIGTNAPTAQLHTTGSVRFQGLTGPGLLSVDATGNVSVSGSAVAGSGLINRLTYWNTGSTVAAGSNLAWDNTNERLGIGISIPEAPLHVHRGAGIEVLSKYTNTNTFIGAGNGFEMGILAAGDAIFRNYENTSMQFLTNNTERMRILGNGNIGLGTAAPVERLEVEGRIQLPNQLTTAAGNKLYASGGNLFWGTTNISNGVINSVLLGGNTVASTMNIGSINAFALELQVNSVRGLRLEVGTVPNLITGSPANTVTAGVNGATVMGGALTTQLNTATDNYSTVSGGLQNRAGNNSGTVADATAATVGGGWQNIASATQSTVSGGFGNNASGDISTIGGGFSNLASGARSAITGGESNTASGGLSSIGGGLTNVASGARSAIPGGEGLLARSFGETVVGLFSSDYVPVNATAYNANDRIFSIGNGTATASRSNAMTVLKNGNVGIGSTNPTSLLGVYGGIAPTAALDEGVFIDIQNTLGVANHLSGIRFKVNSITTNERFNAALFYRMNASVAGELNFAIKPNSIPNISANDIKMTITEPGNVGIGTTAPNAPLQFSNGLVNRKIVLFEGANNDHQYYGFGVTASTLRYQVDATAASHVFYAATSTTASSELMRITGTGNVGIGTATPSRKLSVVGDIDATGGVYFGSVEFFADGGASEIMTNSDIRPETNNVRSLGTSTRRWTTVFATNGSINTSDARLKENITNLNHGLKSILELRPVSYNWIDDTLKRTKLGLIAQEAEKVIPEVVHSPKSAEEFYGLNYADLVPVLIKTAQELHAKIEVLEKENTQLRSQLSTEVSAIKLKHENDLVTLRKQLDHVIKIVGEEARNTDK